MVFLLIVDIFNNVQILVLKGLLILARNSFAGGSQFIRNSLIVIIHSQLDPNAPDNSDRNSSVVLRILI
jgi:hypothetical protein